MTSMKIVQFSRHPPPLLSIDYINSCLVNSGDGANPIFFIKKMKIERPEHLLPLTLLLPLTSISNYTLDNTNDPRNEKRF